jgi:hypothetical protein
MQRKICNPGAVRFGKLSDDRGNSRQKFHVNPSVAGLRRVEVAKERDCQFIDGPIDGPPIVTLSMVRMAAISPHVSLSFRPVSQGLQIALLRPSVPICTTGYRILR